MHSHEAADNMYIDIGLYGEPKVSDYNTTVGKEMELFALKLKGWERDIVIAIGMMR